MLSAPGADIRSIISTASSGPTLLVVQVSLLGLRTLRDAAMPPMRSEICPVAIVAWPIRPVFAAAIHGL